MKLIALLSIFFACHCGQACEVGGKKYKNGEEWIEGNAFVYRCNVHDGGWKTEIIACINRNTKTRIPVGSSVISDSRILKCEQHPDGRVGISSEPYIPIESNPNETGTNPGTKTVCKINGKTYKGGEEWIEGNAFVYRCNVHDSGWKTEIIACLSFNAKTRIAVGSSLAEGNQLLKCEKHPDGTVGISSGPNTGVAGPDPGNKPGCNFDGERRENGEEWIEKKAFVKRCEADENSERIIIIACLSPNTKTRISIGSSHPEGNTIWKCEQLPSGGVSLIPEQNPNAKCKDEQGKEHNKGDRWVNDWQELECKEGGWPNIVGCVDRDSGVKIPLNSEKIIGERTRKCFKNGNTIHFE